MKKLITLLVALFLCLQAFSQTVLSRLTAVSLYGSDPTFCMDSIYYHYSTVTRGGALQPNNPYFDCDYPFVLQQPTDFASGNFGITKFDTATELDFFRHDTAIYIQQFDLNNNIIYANKFWDNAGSLSYSYYTSYGYDTYNNLTEESYPFYITDTAITTFTYDSLNRMISQTILGNDTTYWNKGIYSYDGTGNPDTIKSYGWSTTSSTWQLQTTRKIIYTGSLPSYYVINGSTSYPFYDSGYYYFSPGYDTMITNTGILCVTNIYDASHNKICTIDSVTDTSANWLNNSKTTWTYNSFNQTTSETNYLLDSSGRWTSYVIRRYYYETYTDAIPQVTGQQYLLKVFPVPAQNFINVNLSLPEAAYFTISIVNIYGQVVISLPEAIQTQFEQRIRIDDLPQGNYLVIANIQGKKLTQKFCKLY